MKNDVDVSHEPEPLANELYGTIARMQVGPQLALNALGIAIGMVAANVLPPRRPEERLLAATLVTERELRALDDLVQILGEFAKAGLCCSREEQRKRGLV